ncbi:MAG: aminotransferase class I/II-fold pyridoxal phosphate-dependent enzyme [Glaciimonas sp.]|nr:aminotransferase class I/II-fold pyridoxal phosphate-dependent enzyme [Glaciimonas sp.]
MKKPGRRPALLSGLRALEIPTSPQTGISIEALELAVQTYDNIKAVVMMPYLQNPLGSIMPDAHKKRLAQLCEEREIPLIEDDTYGELAESEIPLTAIKAWDRSGNVIYCTSLDKVLAPGSMFSNSNRFEHFCRINCGLPYSKDLDHALLRLGQTVTRCLRT